MQFSILVMRKKVIKTCREASLLNIKVAINIRGEERRKIKRLLKSLFFFLAVVFSKYSRKLYRFIIQKFSKLNHSKVFKLNIQKVFNLINTHFAN